MKKLMREIIYFVSLFFIADFAVWTSNITLKIKNFEKFGDIILKFTTSNLVKEYVFLAFLCILLSMLISWRRKDEQKSINFYRDFVYLFKDSGFFRFRPQKRKFKIFLIILALVIWEYVDSFNNISSLKDFFESVILWIPLTLKEELVFRYGLFKYLRDKKINVILAYTIPAIVFGMQHYYKNGPLSPIDSVIGATISGLFYQFAYESTGWSIYTSWILHIMDNSLASVHFIK